MEVYPQDLDHLNRTEVPKTLTLTSPPALVGRPRFLLVSSRAGVSLSDMMPGTDTVSHTQARGYKRKNHLDQTPYANHSHKFHATYSFIQ